MPKMLEVNDVIYCERNGNPVSKMQITRVTEKGAFIRLNDKYEMKFKREVHSDNEVIPSPAVEWRKEFYYIETAELRERFAIEVKKAKIKKIADSISKKEFKNFNFAQVSKVLDEMNEILENINVYQELNKDGNRIEND